jgi:RES domain-containing protein
VAIDPALVDLLPSTVAGLAVVRATATEEAAQASPRFADAADGFAAVEVIATDGSDLAIASLVRLRPDASPDTFYADWRPAYDDAACAPARGVSSRESETVGVWAVDATHCLEGATAYHVWLQGRRVLLSVIDVGTTGLGRALIEGAKDQVP